MSELSESEKRAVARRNEIAATSNLPDVTTIAPAPNPGPFRQGHQDTPRSNERHLAALRRQAADIGLRSTSPKEPVRIVSHVVPPARRG
jgi:hypothetical protein